MYLYRWSKEFSISKLHKHTNSTRTNVSLSNIWYPVFVLVGSNINWNSLQYVNILWFFNECLYGNWRNEIGVNVFTSMLSGVPGSVNREPLESSRLTTWPFCTGRPAVGGGHLNSWSLWSCWSCHVWVSAYLLEIQPHRVLCPVRCWFSGCLWSPLISSHPLIPGWTGVGWRWVTWWCKMFVRQIWESRPPGCQSQGVWGDSRWDRGRGCRCAAVPTAASGSGRAAQRVAGKANRSWLAGSKTFTSEGRYKGTHCVITSSFSNRLFLDLVYLDSIIHGSLRAQCHISLFNMQTVFFLILVVTEDTLRGFSLK